MKIRLSAQLQEDSIVDGEGIRGVIWTQGCAHRCKGCHNPETHSFESGRVVDVEELKKQIVDLKIVDGITFTGGDPFYQAEACSELASFIKQKNMNVWAYTGFTFEELLELSKNNGNIKKFLEKIDILVDGKFEIENKSLSLLYRGSTNQRIINVKKSLSKEKVVIERKYMEKEIISKPKYEYIFI